MAIVRRTTGDDLDWSDWLASRFGVEWPGSLLSGDVGMRVEEFRDGEELVIRAEMPDMDPEKDVELTVSNQVLRISAERRRSEETRNKQGYRSEFRYGSYSRTIPLPAGATDQDVKATYQDGILEIRVPLDRGKAETKQIPIGRGRTGSATGEEKAT